MRNRGPVRHRIFAVCLGALAWNCGNEPENHRDAPACGLEYAQAEADTAKAPAYFMQRLQCDPDLKAAKASGKLLGLLFAPSESALREEFARAYGARGFSPMETDELIHATLGGLGWTESFALAEISSTGMDYFGRQVPVFIVINRVMVGSPVIRNEYDVRSLFAHELQHVVDWHDGLEINGTKVVAGSLSGSAVGAEWLVQLLELRADYKVLSLIYRDHVETGSMTHSYEWFASQAPNYRTHWDAITTLAGTEAEQGLSEAQKAVYAGIVPESRGDTLLMHFDLFGRKETAVFLSNAQVAEKRSWSRLAGPAEFLEWGSLRIASPGRVGTPRQQEPASAGSSRL